MVDSEKEVRTRGRKTIVSTGKTMSTVGRRGNSKKKKEKIFSYLKGDGGHQKSTYQSSSVYGGVKRGAFGRQGRTR